LINGSYDLGVAKLMASYYQTKLDAGAKTNSYQLGADIPLSAALTLSAGYASSSISGVSGSSRGYSVAAAYALSKRTTIYGGVRGTNKEAAADLWAVGVNHKF
jgi:predicted porin